MILKALSSLFILMLAAGSAHAAPASTSDLLATLPANLISTALYSLIGMVFFGIAFFCFNKLMPFSVRKEIEEDQNTSLGIIIGSLLIGLAIIIAAAIH